MKSCSDKSGKDIDQKILEYLAKQDWPVTTEMVAKELGVSWNTATPIQTHGSWYG